MDVMNKMEGYHMKIEKLQLLFVIIASTLLINGNMWLDTNKLKMHPKGQKGLLLFSRGFNFNIFNNLGIIIYGFGLSLMQYF